MGHNEPAVGKMKEEQPLWRSRLTLIVVATLFLAPVGTAWWFQSGNQWRSVALVNHGVLVTPARRLDTGYPLTTPLGAPLRAQYLQGKWTLLTIGDASCTVVCANNFYTMRQVSLAQGKHGSRVQRLFVARSRQDTMPDSVAEYPQMEVVVLAATGQASFLAPFMVDVEKPLGHGRIYLVDPRGHLMMYYEPDADPIGILKDLRRLLKIPSSR